MIGIGAIDHTHTKEGAPLKTLMAEKGYLPFVHGAVTAFILVETEAGTYELLSTVRHPKKKYGGRIESVSGGHIDAGETVQRAMTRELSEELGIDITDAPIVAYKRYENKADDNTHDFVGIVVLNRTQAEKMAADLAEKNIRLVRVSDQESLVDHPKDAETLAAWAGQVTGKMAGGKEVAYVLQTPFDVMIAHYRTIKAEDPAKHADQFAWISQVEQDFNDGNFLGNVEMVDAVLSHLANLNQPRV